MTVRFKIWGQETEMPAELFGQTLENLVKACYLRNKSWSEFLKESGFEIINN